jgi:hypothetical protein
MPFRSISTFQSTIQSTHWYDTSTVLTVSTNNAVMWDIRSPRMITSIESPFSTISSAWQNNSDILLGSQDGQLQVWDYRKNKPLRLEQYHLGPIHQIQPNSMASMIGLVFTTTLMTLNNFYQMTYQFQDFDTSSIQSSFFESFVWKLF